MRITKRDIGYTVYSRVEEELREWLKICLLISTDNWKKQIPDGVWLKIFDRTSSNNVDNFDDPFDVLQEIDIPDLEEIIFRKNSPIISNLPIEIDSEKFRINLRILYSLRCKIAHVRDTFNAIDLEKLLDISKEIIRSIESDNEEIINLIEDLNKDIYSQILQVPSHFFSEEEVSESFILNNVPPLDYEDDGGFIGRKDDLNKILDLLQGRLHRVVTIAGAGGVGKTALAHQVCRKFLERKKPQFDAIIWLSAKEEILSLTGIEQIEPDIHNFENLLDEILLIFNFNDSLTKNIEQKKEDVNVILNCTERGLLLVIDNLETIKDESIFEFIKDIPDPNKVLITSRLGLGEVERRYNLQELINQDAINLIRILAIEKGKRDLASLPDEVLLIYALKMSKYPLAIKWVVGQIALGKSIETLIEQVKDAEGDIVRFCFNAIYESLNEKEKKVLFSLANSDSGLARGTLLFVTGFDVEDLENCIHHLNISSLLIPENYQTEEGFIETRYKLLPLTMGFLKSKIKQNPLVSEEIHSKFAQISSTLEEAQRASRHYKYALSDLGASTENERIASLHAITAFQQFTAGDYDSAVQSFQRATNIAPEMPRLYRNWASMESSSGFHVRAEQLMTKATNLNPNDPTLWFIWGNIEKKINHLDKSKKYFLKAKALAPNDGAIIGGLAEVEKRTGNFPLAEELYLSALSLDDNRGLRHKIITLTARADNFRRWGENLKREHKFIESNQKVFEAYKLIKEAKTLDPHDEKTAMTARQCANEVVNNLSREGNVTKAVEIFISEVFIKRPRTATEKKFIARAGAALTKSLIFHGQIEKAGEIYKMCDKVRFHHHDDNEEYAKLHRELNTRKTGTLVRVFEKKGYGFIAVDGLGDIFAHITNFNPTISDSEFKQLEGKRLNFYIQQNEQNKNEAINISISGEE